jgi:hypothetical protein
MAYCFISIKGFGDAIILFDYLSKSSKFLGSKIFVSSQFYSYASTILSDKYRIIIINNISRPFSLYSLKKFWWKLPADIFNIKYFLNKNISSSETLILDIPSLRSSLLFSNFNLQYISYSENIYQDYDKFFDLKRNYQLKDGIYNIAGIFPFGSHHRRHMSNQLISQIIDAYTDLNYAFKVIVHKSHVHLVDEKFIEHLYIFNDILELKSVISSLNVLLTVDSVALHLALALEINVYVCTDEWCKFIPLELIRDGRVFSMNNTREINLKVARDIK